MSFFDFFKVNEYKKEIEGLKEDLSKIKNKQLSMEQMTVLELNEEILKQQKRLQSLENEIEKKTSEYKDIEKTFMKKQEEINTLKTKFLVLEDDLLMESYGLYVPKYDFATSMGYKEKLKNTRTDQKQMIKNKSAVSYYDNWTVNGSKAKGRKMTNDNIKQILRSFNNECEAAINKVKYNNIHSIEKRIIKSFEQLNKLNSSNRLSISEMYLDLKLSELYLAYEYERKKQDEKEALREQREREREEKALQKEIQSKKKIIDKDIKHYQNLINELKKKMNELTSEEERDSIEQQIIDLNVKVNEREEEKKELDYRTAHASAGYVYIISNIGAFGDDVVKIGVTRRIDPLERINELSSASVPFKFDVHALIFSYDAYKLETELHQYFDSYRINKVNNRKEFFKVPISKIEEKLSEYGELTIDFKANVDAEEYRESLLLK
ncbi:DUF4041 domain-containing protein [Vagococcus lutrae]|uniref:DUF4041 domain-containing protein n=1 Tax=Vagococcus lutrae TaxID=81947 RepID=UPI00200E358E|nr:DUF4041 domain-containing protein [Vagococcus lutrae]MDT2806601.1 DUF4041 domain-containing protein [Vagococcus lutrae]MDT2824749.1 DUF4041 domain-containing protein [Vagococcus lutrae]MDT2825190.1 DUF4041 domain-containing protein [Vagococcus lutrae]UQF19157.1 DUF4041 domain-containing protein [Vagococcus lutrae]UQF23420.1 DUF4041 domain-containing protein [Vagococcus lutrae]